MHLGRSHLHVGQPGQLEGDDPVGVGPGPDLVMPLVPGPQAGQPQLGIVGLDEHRATEAGHQGREAQGRPYAVQVHVRHPGPDVEAPRTHVLEPGRVHAPGLLRAADDGVEADVRIPAVLVQPGLGAVGVLDDAGRPSGQSGLDPTLEEIRGFDEVVVHRDDRHPDGPGFGVR